MKPLVTLYPNLWWKDVGFPRRGVVLHALAPQQSRGGTGFDFLPPIQQNAYVQPRPFPVKTPPPGYQYYFAYGSNLNKKQMQAQCPECKPMFVATLPNYRLVFSGWSRQWRGGTATIKAQRGEKVFGAVYLVSEKDLRLLDKQEGYPGTSNRMKVLVFDEDSTAFEAFTYIRTGRLEETEPSRDYLTIVQQGCRDWGITTLR